MWKSFYKSRITLSPRSVEQMFHCNMVSIIIIIITILVINFIQGIYNYTPDTNHVSRVYADAAVLYLQFVPHVKLCRP